MPSFLQELPTEEGTRFINPNFRRVSSSNDLAARYHLSYCTLHFSALFSSFPFFLFATWVLDIIHSHLSHTVYGSLKKPSFPTPTYLTLQRSTEFKTPKSRKENFVPRGTEALVEAWKSSHLYQQMMVAIDTYDHASAGFNSLMCNSESRTMLNEIERSVISTDEEEESKNNDVLKKIQTAIPADSSSKSNEWPAHYQQKYPGSFMYHFKLTFFRQAKLTWRDRTFIYSRVGQCVIVGAIAGSLFSNMAPEDTTTRAGFLFYVILFNAFASFAMIPLCYDQKAVYYKHADALFFPTSAFVVAQTLVLFPLQLIETIIFGVIMYWSAGFASEINGSRFFTFQVMLFTFAVACAQLFRLFSCIMPNVATAFPMAGVGVILMVLFSGTIC